MCMCNEKEVWPASQGRTSLLQSRETPHGVLHPAWDPQQKEGHGPVRMGPEKDCEDDQRAGAPLLMSTYWESWGWRGLERAPGKPHRCLLVLKEGL